MHYALKAAILLDIGTMNEILREEERDRHCMMHGHSMTPASVWVRCYEKWPIPTPTHTTRTLPRTTSPSP